MTNKHNKKIVIGKLASPFGVNGWLNCYSYTDPQERLFHYSPLFLQHQKKLLSIVISEFKKQGDHWTIRLENCHDRDEARRYVHSLFVVDRSQLPVLKKGEYYWTDLEGLKVFNTQGKYLGEIDYLFGTGSNDVMVVKGEKEYLIPYQKKIIECIDLKTGKIIVDWNT